MATLAGIGAGFGGNDKLYGGDGDDFGNGTPGDPNDPRRDRRLKRIGMAERIITGCTAVGSALVSIWTGLASLL